MSDQTFKFRWISGERLMERWGLEPSELDQLCNYCTDDGGIQPYYQMPVFGPQNTIMDWCYEKYGNEDTMNPYFMMCISSNKELESAMFKIEDIEQFEQDHPEMKPHIKINGKRFPVNGIDGYAIKGTASKKLRIAVAAHYAFYESGEHDNCKFPGKSRVETDKQWIAAWIETNFPEPEIEKSWPDEIAKIVNQNLKGKKKKTR